MTSGPRDGWLRVEEVERLIGWCICEAVLGKGGDRGLSFDEFRPEVKFTWLACIKIRKAYLSKESTETMQIEGGVGRVMEGALCVHLVQKERGRGDAGAAEAWMCKVEEVVAEAIDK